MEEMVDIYDADGNVFGYVQGAITYEIMESMVQQTMEGDAEDE